MDTAQFDSSADFQLWLEKNHSTSNGIWLRLCKKGAPEQFLSYAEALDQALCYGWIDGQRKALDELSFVQRFTPRRARSGWSKINTRHAERLIKAGQMTPAGLKAIQAAKADGRWAAAYDSPGTAQPPDDFLKQLSHNKKAQTFFQSLNRANVYAIVYRLQTAKRQETRERRMRNILTMLEEGRKFHD